MGHAKEACLEGVTQAALGTKRLGGGRLWMLPVLRLRHCLSLSCCSWSLYLSRCYRGMLLPRAAPSCQLARVAGAPLTPTEGI